VYKKIAIIMSIVIFNSGCSGKSSEELYAVGVKTFQAGNAKGAIVYFRNSLAKDQNNLDARYQLAKAYLALANYEMAEKELQKVRCLNPKQTGIELELAKIYNGLRKPDSAISHAEQFLKVVPDSAEALETIGVAYGIKNEPQQAETFLLRALQNNPEKQTSKLELATLYLRQGRARQSAVLLEELIKSNPRNSKVISILADTDIALGRKDLAQARYRQLSVINPNDPVAPYKSALLDMEMGQSERVGKTAAELIKKFPLNAEGYRLQGIDSYRKGRFTEAIALLQNANKLQPNLAGYYFLGLSMYGKGDLESALSQFRQILDRNPAFHQARLLTGMILLQQKRVDDSILELSKLLETDYQNAQLHSLLGSAYMVKGLYEEGIKELDIATKIDPKRVEAYMKKGMFFLSQGNNAEVEVDFSTALRIAPELSVTRLILASFYHHRGNRQKALATLKDGITGSKNDSELYCGMARIMFASSNPTEALNYLAKAKEIDPVSVAPHVILAAYYTVSADLAKALAEYTAILTKEPGNIPAMLRMASLMESVGNENGAVTLYTKAKETHNPAAYLALSRYYEKKGNSEKSLATIMEAGQFNPRSVDLQEQKARLYLKNEQFKDALSACDDLASTSPERAATQRVAVYLAMKKMPEAINEAGRTITLKPDSANGYLLLAAVYEAAADFIRATETLQRCVQRIPNNPQATLALAALYSKTGMHNTALKISDEFIRRRPRYAPAYFAQGTFLEAMGNRKGAVKKYRTALLHSENYAVALNNLAYLYLEGYGGSMAEGLQLVERAVVLEPENPGILDTLGYALFKNSRFQEARVKLEKAVALQPGDPTINYHLALVHRASGDTNSAVARLQIALRSDSFTGIKQAKDLLRELK